MAEKEKTADKKEAVLIEVPTQTAIAYKLDEETIVDEKGILIRIYNDIQQIKKALV